MDSEIIDIVPQIGDKVKFKLGFGNKQNKVFTVQEIKEAPKYRTKIGIKLNGDKIYYDSGWFILVDDLSEAK